MKTTDRIYMLLLPLALLAYGCTEILPSVEDTEEVKLRICLDGSGIAAESKATAPFDPDVENLIYDIWVVQFNSQGVRLRYDYYDRGGAAGLYVDDFEATLYAAAGSTVCLLVNTGNPNLGTETFPNNLPDYQCKLYNIDVSNDLSLRDRMPMCGYWKGDVSGSTQVLTVQLSRMMTRLNIILDNATGAALNNLNVWLGNVPTMSYVYPDVNHEPLPTSAYLQAEFTDTRTSNLANGATAEFYYYISPNICTDPDFATTVTVTANSGSSTGTQYTWSAVLGNDSPSTTGRDYSLYANNFYTFSFNLDN